MERFPKHLNLRKLEKFNWKFLGDFVYKSDKWGRLTVPKGTVTDLTSVPAIGRVFVSRDGDHIKPAVIHDYGYATHDVGPFKNMTRQDVDELMLEAMKARGVSWFKRNIIYRAVRLGGGKAFRVKTKTTSNM